MHSIIPPHFRRAHRFSSALTWLLALSWLGSWTSVSRAGAAATGQQESRAPAEALSRWQDRRFGMFIHYGPVSLKGTEISWSRAGERRDRQETITNGIPAAAYDQLYLQFDPTKFNAREWVAIAKQAGMKYIVFTTKHHDGFVMFES